MDICVSLVLFINYQVVLDVLPLRPAVVVGRMTVPVSTRRATQPGLYTAARDGHLTTLSTYVLLTL